MILISALSTIGKLCKEPIHLSGDFSVDTIEDRKEWHGIFKVLNGKNLQPRTLYPARLSFIIEEIKSFSDK